MNIGKNVPHITIETNNPTELVELKKIFSQPVQILFARNDNTEIVLGRGSYITNQSVSSSANIDPQIYLTGNGTVRLTSTDPYFEEFVTIAKAANGIDAVIGNSGSTIILLPKNFASTVVNS